jgi:pre-rRNA-processing protein TSR1
VLKCSASLACAPQDYARVFAFENFKRTQRRAKEAAARVGAAGDPDGVPAGTYVQLHVAGVPAEAAGTVLARVAAASQVCGE